MKKEARILGIDDTPFNKFNQGERVLVIGTIFRGGKVMEGLMTTHITADGEDSTRNLIQMINKSRNKGQLAAILLDGVALGGLNVVDINELSRRTKLPVITVMRKQPNLAKMKKAIQKVSSPDQKIDLLDLAGDIHQHENIFYQVAGATKTEAQKVLKLTTTHGLLPEPLRIAHIIGSGIVNGESKGRA